MRKDASGCAAVDYKDGARSLTFLFRQIVAGEHTLQNDEKVVTGYQWRKSLVQSVGGSVRPFSSESFVAVRTPISAWCVTVVALFGQFLR